MHTVYNQYLTLSYISFLKANLQTYIYIYMYMCVYIYIYYLRIFVYVCVCLRKFVSTFFYKTQNQKQPGSKMGKSVRYVHAMI
jgi:hypothetical protein